MRDRATLGALGCVVVALALCALRHGREPPPPAAALAKPDAGARHPARAPGAAAVRALRAGRKLDLNRASAADLELLPGIGPTLARRIVADRRLHGRFARVPELARVRGIGPRTLQRLGALVCVAACAQGRAPAASPAGPPGAPLSARTSTPRTASRSGTRVLGAAR